MLPSDCSRRPPNSLSYPSILFSGQRRELSPTRSASDDVHACLQLLLSRSRVCASHYEGVADGRCCQVLAHVRDDVMHLLCEIPACTMLCQWMEGAARCLRMSEMTS